MLLDTLLQIFSRHTCVQCRVIFIRHDVDGEYLFNHGIASSPPQADPRNDDYTSLMFIPDQHSIQMIDLVLKHLR